MNKQQLKQVIKPMVKDCVYELLLEEGFLSGIISEVAKGLAGATLISEAQQPQPIPQPQPAPRTDFSTQKNQLMEAIGKGAYNDVNLFENTTPAPPTPKSAGPGSAMSGIDPNDRGIDISAIERLAGRNWKNLI